MDNFKKENGSYISLEELSDVVIRYVRNIKLGLNERVTVPQLLKWLKLNMYLVEYPSYKLLSSWVSMDMIELSKWSYDNDPRIKGEVHEERRGFNPESEDEDGQLYYLDWIENRQEENVEGEEWKKPNSDSETTEEGPPNDGS
jgi:hypothetical protein